MESFSLISAIFSLISVKDYVTIFILTCHTLVLISFKKNRLTTTVGKWVQQATVYKFVLWFVTGQLLCKLLAFRKCQNTQCIYTSKL